MSNKSLPADIPVIDLTRQNTEKCLFSFKVLNRTRRVVCCLHCFCSTGLIRSVRSFEVYITHHVTNRPHSAWPCAFCLKDTIQVRRAIECSLCLNNYFKVKRHLREQNINIDQVHYMFDNFHEKFEYLGPLLETSRCQ